LMHLILFLYLGNPNQEEQKVVGQSFTVRKLFQTGGGENQNSSSG